MGDKKRTKSDGHDNDIMHGRSFAGAEYASTERDKTRDIERSRRVGPDEAGEFVTDAELDARSESSAQDADREDR